MIGGSRVHILIDAAKRFRHADAVQRPVWSPRHSPPLARTQTFRDDIVGQEAMAHSACSLTTMGARYAIGGLLNSAISKMGLET